MSLRSSPDFSAAPHYQIKPKHPLGVPDTHWPFSSLTSPNQTQNLGSHYSLCFPGASVHVSPLTGMLCPIPRHTFISITLLSDTILQGLGSGVHFQTVPRIRGIAGSAPKIHLLPTPDPLPSCVVVNGVWAPLLHWWELGEGTDASGTRAHGLLEKSCTFCKSGQAR